MKNFKLTIEYDGSRYSGWQRLGKGESTNTIENKIKEVLKKMSGQDVELFCGSRTEAGVHAYGQVISCKLDTDLSAAKVRQYLNRYLPMDIAVLEAEEMPERFHAALNARSRTYVYRVAIGDVPSVFERKYTYYCFGRPDVSTMKEAAALLKGTHDFAAFSTAKKSKSTVRTITDLEVYADDKDCLLYTSSLAGNSRMISFSLSICPPLIPTICKNSQNRTWICGQIGFLFDRLYSVW